MGRDAHALLTGLFVLVLGCALLLMALWLGQYGKAYNVYVVTTQNAVSGLKPESTVYYRGVEAGKVTQMGFDPKDVRTIQVRIKVGKHIPITNKSFAKLRVQPLTGLAQIELDNAQGDAQPLQTSEVNPATIPLHPSLMDHLTDSGRDMLGQTEQLLVRLNDLLKDENRERVHHILGNVETVSARLIKLEDRLDTALTGLPALSGDARRTLGHIDELVVDLKETSRRLRGFGELGDSLMQTTLPRLDSSLGELQDTADQIKKLARHIDKDPQALLLGPAPAAPGPGEAGYPQEQP
ncbi:MAG: MCE family protein [Methylococcaceae bacterium]|nr:MAG: MCE family protein [Methylococcaceae bacterium]